MKLTFITLDIVFIYIYIYIYVSIRQYVLLVLIYSLSAIPILYWLMVAIEPTGAVRTAFLEHTDHSTSVSGAQTPVLR